MAGLVAVLMVTHIARYPCFVARDLRFRIVYRMDSVGGMTMKNYMIIKQRVADLARCQAAFDELRMAREAHGLHDVGQFRSADEADTVIVILKVDDPAPAKAYWHSDVLAEGRKKAGVVGPLLAGVDQVWLADGPVRARSVESRSAGGRARSRPRT
jgi:hypothetical protein